MFIIQILIMRIPMEINDYQELNVYNTNPNNEDTDGDGIHDDIEINLEIYRLLLQLRLSKYLLY